MAIDCGFCANPERVESQMQGAAVMGMTVALHSGITFENGAVVQSNFYELQRRPLRQLPDGHHTHHFTSPQRACIGRR